MSLERQMYSKEEIFKRYQNAKAKCELNIIMVKLYNQKIKDFQKEDSQRARRGESIFRGYKEGGEKIIPRDKEKLETSLSQLSDMFVNSINLWPAIFSEITTVPEDKLISMFVEWMEGEKLNEALELHNYEFEEITLPLILSDFVRKYEGHAIAFLLSLDRTRVFLDSVVWISSFHISPRNPSHAPLLSYLPGFVIGIA